MINDYLKPLTTLIASAALSLSLMGNALAQNNPTNLAEKQAYVSTFMQNYLKSKGGDINSGKPLKIRVILDQTDYDELNATPFDELRRRSQVGDPLVKDGFPEFADIAVGKDPKDGRSYFVVQYIPEKEKGVWFRDIGETGFEFGTRSLSDIVDPKYSNEEVSEMKLGEGDFIPMVSDLTYNFNWINLTKSNHPNTDRFVRSLTEKDQIEQNARFEKALDHIIETLKLRYQDKFNP